MAPQAFVFGQNLRDRVKVFAGWVWARGLQQPLPKETVLGTHDSHTSIQTSTAQGPHPVKNPCLL